MSLFISIAIGLEEPVEWREIICTIARAEIINGNKKCREKNRVKVGLQTENPPHSQITISFPQKGIADNKFVITVAAQKDIWPHGRTYPRNAVAIRINKIIIPEFQVWFNLKDLKSKFLAMWE